MRCMKNLFLLFLLLGISTARADDQDCLYIINPELVLRKPLDMSEVNPGVGFLPNPSYLETAMSNLGVNSEAEQKIFMAAMELKPKLDSELLYEAIATEAMMRGFKGQAGIEKLITHFTFLASKEKRSMIDGVLQNILFNLGEGVDFNNLDQTKKLAKKYKISETYFLSLIQNLEAMTSSHFEEAKLVILDFLLAPSPLLIKNISSSQKQFSGLFKKPLPPHFKLESDHNLQTFMTYIEKSNTRMKIYFITQNLDQMSTDQLLIVKRDQSWSALPDHLKKQIEDKINLGSPSSQELASRKLLIQESAIRGFKTLKALTDALHSAQDESKAQSLLEYGVEMIRTQEDFIEVFRTARNGNTTLTSARVKARNLPLYLDHFFQFKPRISAVNTLLKNATTYDAHSHIDHGATEKIYLRAAAQTEYPAEYNELFTSLYNTHEDGVYRQILGKSCVATLDHYFSLNPTGSDVRALINNGWFNDHSRADEEILTKAALGAKSIGDYLLILDEFSRRTESFQVARRLALKLSLKHFFELGPTLIEVDELIARTNFSKELNSFILKKYESLKTQGSK